MEFRVLGQVEAIDDGVRCPVSAGRQLALLALLLVHANRVLSADRILDELWGDDPPESGPKTVGFHVSKLRDALSPGRERGLRPAAVGDGPLLTLDGGYLLRVDPDRLDAARFEHLAGEGRALLAADPATAADRLAAALGEWHGPAYAQVEDEPFARSEITRLEDLRLRATEDAFDAALALGRHVEALTGLAAHVDTNPLREHARVSLMTALYRAGRQAEALRTYAEGRTILAEELGIEPGPELRRVEALVLQQDPSLDFTYPPRAGGADVSVAVRNPYKGLRPFSEADSADFFGRETLVASLLDRLGSLARSTRLLALVGPSGSGKSRLVQAGLVPALRTGAVPSLAGAPVASLMPGPQPVRDLERALAELREAGWPTGVLVIDQLEELPTLAGEEHASRFLVRLEEALADSSGDAGPVLVAITTLRADRLDLPLGVPGLAERVRQGTEIVGPLVREDLERAISRPAERLGLAVEPGLAREIAADVGSQPGALPLLQFALTDLFERRDGTRLTRAAYLASGGVEGALATRAEEAWAALDSQEREVARQVFLRLVAVTESGDPVGRRRPRSDLAPASQDTAALDRLLDVLARRRLIALDRDPGSGDPVVLVAHDALLTRWPRLAGWIREARDDLAMRRRLTEATAEWEASSRDPGFLLTGSRLDLFAAWATTTELPPDERERRLLDASLMARGRSEAAEEARSAREHGLEHRATTRLRALVVVLTAGILAVSGLSIGLSVQGAAAVEQARIAGAREAAAAAIGNVRTDPRLALLLAWQAATSTTDLGYVTEQAMDALHWALQASHAAYPADAGDTPGARASVRTGPEGEAAVPLLEPGKLLALAAAQPGRNLTAAECRTYLHRDACPPPPSTGAVPAGDLGVLTAAGVVPVASLAAADLAGTSVDIVSQLPVDVTGPLASLVSRAGVHVSLTGDDAGAVLASRVAAGDEPDIAIVARPRDVFRLAQDGHLVDLATLVDRDALAATVGAYLLAAGTVGTDGSWPAPGGRLLGAPLAVTDESLLWTPASTGSAPATWAEVVEQVRLGTGAQPGGWCMGLAGDAGADDLVGVLEDGLLATGDMVAYDAWAVGDVRRFERIARGAFARVRDVTDPALVSGGLPRAEVTPPDLAAWPMLEAPSSCLYHPGGGTERLDWYAHPDVTPGPVPVPGITADAAPLVRGRLYTVVVLHDRPEVRQVLHALLDTAGASDLDPALARGGLWRPGAGTGPAPERDWLQTALDGGRFRIRLQDTTPARVAAAASEGIRWSAKGGGGDFALFISGLGQAWREAWDARETGLAGG